jgi:hypothetical protein
MQGGAPPIPYDDLIRPIARSCACCTAPARDVHQEAPMIGSTPRFPAFDEWQRMSESEQDAFISRLEAARRRRSLVLRILLGLAGASFIIVVAWQTLGP